MDLNTAQAPFVFCGLDALFVLTIGVIPWAIGIATILGRAIAGVAHLFAAI